MKILEKIKDKLPFKKSTENLTSKKNKKQEKKKSKLKTFINILAYIFGGIFLIVLLFSCVNSCKGNNNNEDNKKSLNDVVLKAPDVTPNLERDYNNLVGTTWRFNQPLNYDGTSTWTSTFYLYFTGNNIRYNQLNYWPTWGMNTSDGGMHEFRLFTYPNTTINDINYLEFTIDEIYNTTESNIDGLYGILDNLCTQVVEPEPEPSVEPSLDPSVNPSIDNSQELESEYNYIDTIVFNNAYDWRILFSGGYQKNTGLFFLDSSYAISNPVVHFTGMEFVCDGVLYNTIDITLIVCDNANVVYTGYDNEGKQIEYVVNTSNLFSYNSDKSLCAIVGVYYRYYDGAVDNLLNVTNQVHVYNGTQINYIAPSTEGGSTYVQSVNYNLHEWLGNSYKKLSIVSASTEGANSLYPNISTYELITNNENLVITEYGELGDVFSLLGGGFTALTSVFGIYILPNISIGVLIFLPLVVVMFITIIRLIKK